MVRFDYTKLAADLDEWRHIRRISLRDLSEAVNVSTSTLCRMETGKGRATVENVLPIVKLLGKTLNDYVAST